MSPAAIQQAYFPPLSNAAGKESPRGATVSPAIARNPESAFRACVKGLRCSVTGSNTVHCAVLSALSNSRSLPVSNHRGSATVVAPESILESASGTVSSLLSCEEQAVKVRRTRTHGASERWMIIG